MATNSDPVTRPIPCEIRNHDESAQNTTVTPVTDCYTRYGSKKGVLAIFVLLGFFGIMLHCSSANSNNPRMAGCQNCYDIWGILDSFPTSMEACFALVVIFVVIFAILGIAYGFLAATMAIQRICHRHYHILTKRELTKEYIVEDLHGGYTPPKLDLEHEERLKMLRLF